MEVRVLFVAPLACARGNIPGTHWIGGLVSPRGGLDAWRKEMFLPLQRIEPWSNNKLLTAVTEHQGLWGIFVLQNRIQFPTLCFFCVCVDEKFSCFKHSFSHTYPPTHPPTYLPTYLPPWSGILMKIIVTLLVKKLPAFYGTRSFITVFTRAHHRSLSWRHVYSIHNFPHSFPKIRSNIILPSISSGFPTKIVYAFLISPMSSTSTAHLILLFSYGIS
jgi:hypothetical protein